jgi:hypothetical protein
MMQLKMALSRLASKGFFAALDRSANPSVLLIAAPVQTKVITSESGLT